MKKGKTLLIIIVTVAVLSAVTAGIGLFSKYPGNGPETIVSVWGEKVQLYGRGIYSRDSTSFAVQGRAQDAVTLFIAIPFLLFSFVLMRRGSLRGLLLTAGIMAYFLYTYLSYAFIVVFNPLFPLYTLLITFSLGGFILLLVNIDHETIVSGIKKNFPTRRISFYYGLVGILILFMWAGRLFPALAKGTAPFGIDHYSTLGIQVLDLSLVVPLCFVTACLLLRGNPWGYILAVIVSIKAMTLLLAIVAMIIAEYAGGVPMNPVEIGLFLGMAGLNILAAAVSIRSVPGRLSNGM